jgi:transposase InsO family protein
MPSGSSTSPELRVGAERVSVLVLVDDYSRFIVGHAVATEPSSEVAVETLKRAIGVHGKCEAVYTDRGGAFLAWRDRSGFQRYLEQELIEHHVSRPYRPQGRGKVEALIGTLQRELWQVPALRVRGRGQGCAGCVGRALQRATRATWGSTGCARLTASSAVPRR